MKNKEFFNEYTKVFLNQNSKLNLISKNDEKFLWEKHIFDSLAIEKFFEKYKPSGSKLLDIGTGGGFPSVPTALAYPEIEVFALDSIRKKVNAIENIKAVLNIKNLHTICDRAENIKDKFNLVIIYLSKLERKIFSYNLLINNFQNKNNIIKLNSIYLC